MSLSDTRTHSLLVTGVSCGLSRLVPHISNEEFTEVKAAKSSVSHQHGALSQEEPPADSKAGGNSTSTQLSQLFCGLIFGSIMRVFFCGILSLVESLSDFSPHQ